MCEMTSKTSEVQSCELKFGSWVYNVQQLDLINVSQTEVIIKTFRQ